jgi:hypothetical protein
MEIVGHRPPSPFAGRISQSGNQSYSASVVNVSANDSGFGETTESYTPGCSRKRSAKVAA